MEIMHKDLVNAYAHGNMQEALLVALYVELLRGRYVTKGDDGASVNSNDLEHELKVFQAKIQNFLKFATYPKDESGSEAIRQSAIGLTNAFFQDVRDILVPDDCNRSAL